jgi:DNA polymerase-3 subunit delta'
VSARSLDHVPRRIALAAGSLGVAISLDLEEYDRRRKTMFALLKVASGAAPFSDWIEHSDALAAAREDKLEAYLKVLYGLVADLVAVRDGSGEVRNPELKTELEKLAALVSFNWIRLVVGRVDELVSLLRRNIQKSIALDALILELRASG